MSNEFAGGCYCGNITVTFHSETAPEDLHPRTCDCGFCVRNGANWLSDPEGKIEIDVMNEAALSLYSQGSESAKFWICQRCGTASAVTCEIDGSLHGAVNANCLDNPTVFGSSETISPKTLDTANKIERWSDVWTKDVVVKEAWDVGL